jgi:glycerophosphoryl diester phosphodiesterase
MGCAAGAPPQTSEPAFTSPKGPVIVAHRGGALEAPENTLAAVKHGIRVGSDWQEIDVRLSKDLRVVVMHDDTVDRTTNGSGPVSEMLAADLQHLTAGHPKWSEKVSARLGALGVLEPVFDDRFAEEKVPTLEQVLSLQGSRLMIEIRTDPRAELVVRKVIDVIDRTGAHGRVAIGSFDQAILRQALEQDPSIPLIGIAKTEKDVKEKLELPLSALAVRQSLVETALVSAPTRVAVWAYTAYSPEQASALSQQGVHGIVTDIPSQVVHLLSSQVD